MTTPSGFLGSRPFTRFVAALLIVTLTGCYTSTWVPVTQPIAAADVVEVRLPKAVAATRGIPRRMSLTDPRFEGDSLLVGRALRGGVPVDSAGTRLWLARYPLAGLEVRMAHQFNAARTSALVVGGAAVVLVVAAAVAVSNMKMGGIW